MVPDAMFPRSLYQVRKVYNFLVDCANVESDSIIMTGDSAGGNLVLATLLTLRGDEHGKPYVVDNKHEKKYLFPQGKQPLAAILFSPMLDNRPNRQYFQSNYSDWLSKAAINSFSEAYFGYDASMLQEHELASPLLAKTLNGLPPILIQYGTEELFGQDCERFFKRLVQENPNGYNILEKYEGMDHVFNCGHFLGCDIASLSFQKMQSFIHKCLD